MRAPCLIHCLLQEILLVGAAVPCYICMQLSKLQSTVSVALPAAFNALNCLAAV